jgi:hypothetical protein
MQPQIWGELVINGDEARTWKEAVIVLLSHYNPYRDKQ